MPSTASADLDDIRRPSLRLEQDTPKGGGLPKSLRQIDGSVRIGDSRRHRSRSARRTPALGFRSTGRVPDDCNRLDETAWRSSRARRPSWTPGAERRTRPFYAGRSDSRRRANRGRERDVLNTMCHHSPTRPRPPLPRDGVGTTAVLKCKCQMLTEFRIEGSVAHFPEGRPARWPSPVSTWATSMACTAATRKDSTACAAGRRAGGTARR